MIEEDITATIFFSIISLIFIYLGREKIIENLESIKKCNKEVEENLKQKKFEEEIRLKQQEYDNKIRKIKMEIAHEKRMEELNNILKTYKLIPPTETEIRITIEKIQEIYKELGFNVKVIDIRKGKYNTEYEVIFNKDIKHYQILSLEVSQKLKEEFAIDGISIKAKKGATNHLLISVPFEYNK